METVTGWKGRQRSVGKPGKSEKQKRIGRFAENGIRVMITPHSEIHVGRLCNDVKDGTSSSRPFYVNIRHVQMNWSGGPLMLQLAPRCQYTMAIYGVFCFKKTLFTCPCLM